MAEQPDDQRAAEAPMCWYSPSLGFLVPDPLSDDGQGAIRVANRYVVSSLPDDAVRLEPADRLRAELAETRTALDAARLDFYAVMRAADDVLAVHPSRDRAPGRSVYDALRATVAEYRGAGRSVRGDAPTEPPAVGLPVTLSSVDDVAAVCEQAGLDRNGDEWHADGVRVERVARQGWVYLVHRHWLMYGRQPIAELHPGAPSSLLLAAIEAARGGSR